MASSMRLTASSKPSEAKRQLRPNEVAHTDRHVDGVDKVLDATQQHDQKLTVQRLCGWHATLFPKGYSGMTPIRVGAWRNGALGPKQVASGPLHRPRVQ